MNAPGTERPWYLYLIETSEQTLYTGITTDPERRLKQHRAGQGARFLRGKGPLIMRFSQAVGDKSTALRLEIRVKKLRRSEKVALIEGRRGLPELS